MAVLQLPPDFEKFSRLLNARSVEYLIVGGYAVAIHGYPRTTGDLDIWIAVGPENARAVSDSLREFGFESPEVSPDLFLHPSRPVSAGEPAGSNRDHDRGHRGEIRIVLSGSDGRPDRKGRCETLDHLRHSARTRRRPGGPGISMTSDNYPKPEKREHPILTWTRTPLLLHTVKHKLHPVFSRNPFRPGKP